ncbi:uncharacterized protein PV09_06420 [Verruconis gallopava]|uniref:Uncharacterized protein n=1 Tax=Verruconis gallopava TaxID=253628 RepID=A0A0D2A6R2_9PEZI|nr:uncharacterized protein PV09_06420 [Verruconis gallopava]KIW02270.1 hypothetical protein PV09_06420 [Verruconis gallopava]
MDYDKIEKQPSLPVVDLSEKDYGYEKPKHFSQHVAAGWPNELPPDTYKPETSRTDHIEDVNTRQSSIVEYPPEVPLTRKQKTVKHLRRYWICYVLLGIVALAVGLPIFFLVILPAIAQRLVDSASLPISSSKLMKPTPDTITVSLVASLKVPLGLTVHLDPTDLHLYRPETHPFTPYVTVRLPAQKLHGNTTITLENQTVQIQNLTEFQAFLTTAVYAEEFILSARGSTTAHLGALKVPLTLDKGIKLKGLNQLKGFSILAAQALVTPEADGTNFKGTANLPNPSLVGFELGNEVLDLMIPNGLVVGQGTIINATIAPGNNTVDFSGIVDYNTLFSNIQSIINAEADALARGNLALNARGNSTVYDGTHIMYYENILNNMTLGTEVPVTQFIVGTVGGLLNSSSATLGDLVDLIQGNGITGFLGLLSSVFTPTT